MIKAWMMTRMVSPKLPSDFVPELTLIAFRFLSRRRAAPKFSTEAERFAMRG
ncbi:MAG: hypothetical protein MZV49_02600 [Rhodopseudomonas palustris]|nr:hypothetical protein [Rhodopseudomonas palustris]